MKKLPEELQDHRVIGASQGAEYIGVSIATFRRMGWAGKLPPAIRLSDRRVGWRVSDLRAWLTSRQTAENRPTAA